MSTRKHQANERSLRWNFNTPTTFPESGSRKRFHTLIMRAIDSSHKIRPRKVLFRKFFFAFFSIIGHKCYAPIGSERIFALKRSSTLIFKVKLIFSCFENAQNRFSPRNYPKKLFFRRKSKNFFRFFENRL